LVDQADAHVKAAAAARATLNNPSSTFQELDAALKSVMQLGTELGNTRKALVAALNNGAPAKVAPEEVQALKDGFDKAGTQVVDLRKRVAMSKENQSEEEKNSDLKKVDEAQSDINAAKQSLDGEGVTAESLARLKAILGELKAKLDPLEGRYPKG
jgi:predicted  nucleic acid-binding Zn-ribbon protein